jgi:hypothetical protein
MAVVVPRVGAVRLLEQLLGRNDWLNPARLFLYKNDTAPKLSSVRSDFDRATFDGFEPVELQQQNWMPPVAVGDYAQVQYGATAIQWTSTDPEPQMVFGYFVTDVVGVALLWAERFDEPIEVTNGGTVQVLPVLTLKSEVSG